MKLSELIKIKKKRKLIGRGGGRGGTSGKGNKGQKARSGGFVKAQFEGGQTPLTRRIPKRGFNNKNFATRYDIIAIEKIIEAAKKYDTYVIDKSFLVNNSLLRKLNTRVKVLFSSKNIDLTVAMPAIHITVDACSSSVKNYIEKNGGSVTTKETIVRL
jgi:large subunit ribosomal protein L15